MVQSSSGFFFIGASYYKRQLCSLSPLKYSIFRISSLLLFTAGFGVNHDLLNTGGFFVVVLYSDFRSLDLNSQLLYFFNPLDVRWDSTVLFASNSLHIV